MVYINAPEYIVTGYDEVLKVLVDSTALEVSYIATPLPLNVFSVIVAEVVLYNLIQLFSNVLPAMVDVDAPEQCIPVDEFKIVQPEIVGDASLSLMPYWEESLIMEFSIIGFEPSI